MYPWFISLVSTLYTFCIWEERYITQAKQYNIYREIQGRLETRVWYGSVYTGMLFLWSLFTTVGQYYNETMKHFLSTHDLKYHCLSQPGPVEIQNHGFTFIWFAVSLRLTFIHFTPQTALCGQHCLSHTYTINQSINQSVLRPQRRDSGTVMIHEWSLTEYWIVLLLDTHKDLMCPTFKGLSRGCCVPQKVWCLHMNIWDVKGLLCILNTVPTFTQFTFNATSPG